MCEDNRDQTDPDLEDLAQAPFLDEDERAEATWLIERDRDPSAPAPSPAVQREYAELEDLLGSLPPIAEVAGWQQAVLRRAAAAAAAVASVPAADEPPKSPPLPINDAKPPVRRRAARWAAGAALAAVAAAVLALVNLRPRSPSPADELRIELRHGDQVRGDQAEAAIGDTLVIRGHSLETGDLRVFRADGTPAGWCPDGPGCSLAPSGRRSLEIKLDRPTEYRLILVIGLAGTVPGKTWSEYLAEVRARNGIIALEQRIEVH